MENKENIKQVTPMLKVSENIKQLKSALQSIEIKGKLKAIILFQLLMKEDMFINLISKY